VIGIICSTQAQRDTLLSQIDKFVTFIEQIAVMISSKVFECLERLRAQETLGAFRRLIDAMDRGVVAIDGNGRSGMPTIQPIVSSTVTFRDCLNHRNNRGHFVWR
jgi:hypothetical protein